MAVQPNDQRTAPVPFPEGVASEDGAHGFVALRTAGVLALELASGTDLWISAVDARPRLVLGDRLVAEDRARSRDNVLQFVTLKLDEDGRSDRELPPIALPDWVAVNDPDRVFEYDVSAENLELVIAWRAESFYTGGAPPPMQIEADARRQTHGEARIDLRNGRLVRSTTASAAAMAAQTETVPDAGVFASLVPPDGRQPSVVEGRLFYLLEAARSDTTRGRTTGLQLVCVDVRTGETKWTRSLPERRTTAPARRM